VSLQPCQEDAYALRGRSRVLSCAPVADGRFDVVVDRSVLYPEGGGQPPDHGTVGGVPVVDVQLDDSGVVHLTALAAVSPGEAEVVVDAARRFDHMQQHSAQHLITAVAQDRFGRSTTSFHLGAETCSIDLDGPLSEKAVRELEDAVNAEIRANRAVRSRVVSLAEYQQLDVRSRGLPAGYVGDVRLVEIDGLDVNTCGGTHVAWLGELQMVHLIGTEKVRGGARLSYVAGGRVLSRLRADTARSGALTRRLKCGPAEHEAALERLVEDAKSGAKARKQLLGELGQALGAGLAGANPERAVHLHRPEADLGLLKGIADAARAGGLVGPLLLTGGGPEGVFLLDADPPVVEKVGPVVAAAVSGRGGGRGRRFQGKAERVDLASVALLPEPVQ
jgi:misacylated tRNA(Ala) deacylase